MALSLQTICCRYERPNGIACTVAPDVDAAGNKLVIVCLFHVLVSAKQCGAKALILRSGYKTNLCPSYCRRQLMQIKWEQICSGYLSVACDRMLRRGFLKCNKIQYLWKRDSLYSSPKFPSALKELSLQSKCVAAHNLLPFMVPSRSEISGQEVSRAHELPDDN